MEKGEGNGKKNAISSSKYAKTLRTGVKGTFLKDMKVYRREKHKKK